MTSLRSRGSTTVQAGLSVASGGTSEGSSEPYGEVRSQVKVSQPHSRLPRAHRSLLSYPESLESSSQLLTCLCAAYVVTGSQDSLIHAYEVPQTASSSPDEFAAATSNEPSRTLIGHSQNVCCIDGLMGGNGLGQSHTISGRELRIDQDEAHIDRSSPSCSL